MMFREPKPRWLAAHPVGLPVAAICFAAALLQTLVPPVADVSWLLVVGERMLSGDRLYVDIWETNPPLAVFLYMPALMAERFLGVQAEAVVLVLVLAAAAAAVALADRALRPGASFDTALAAALTLLPVGLFGQRDHVALILEVPILATAAALASGAAPSAGLRVAAGVGAGLAMAIKPQFAVPILAAYLYAAWRLRSVRPLFGVEIAAASLVVVAFAGAVVVFFPAYLGTIVPIVAATYLHARAPLVVLGFATSALYYGLFAVAAWRTWAAGGRPLPTTLLAASLGFFLAYDQQGKGWPYHLYPALALVMLVLLADAVEAMWKLRAAGAGTGEGAAQRLGIYAVAGALAAGVAYAVPNFLAVGVDPRALAAAVKAVAPPHPRILAIGGDHSVGHPLTRLLGATWVGPVSCQWISATARGRIARDPGDAAVAAAMRRLIEQDRDMLADAIRTGRPDVILFDRRGRDNLAFAEQDPVLAPLLADYRPRADYGGVDIWKRTSPPPS